MLKMKSTDLKLVSELMKNSRRSDRELARVLGISQPTVTRARVRLEKEGYIKEYTLIPDFKKLGFHIMAMIFLKLSHPLSSKEREEMFQGALQPGQNGMPSFFMAMDGIGMNQDMVIVSFFRNFSEYASYIQSTRSEMTNKLKPFVHTEGVTSFLMNLDGDAHYQQMTFSRMATQMQSVLDMSETPGKP